MKMLQSFIMLFLSSLTQNRLGQGIKAKDLPVSFLKLKSGIFNDQRRVEINEVLEAILHFFVIFTPHLRLSIN